MASAPKKPITLKTTSASIPFTPAQPVVAKPVAAASKPVVPVPALAAKPVAPVPAIAPKPPVIAAAPKPIATPAAAPVSTAKLVAAAAPIGVAKPVMPSKPVAAAAPSIPSTPANKGSTSLPASIASLAEPVLAQGRKAVEQTLAQSDKAQESVRKAAAQTVAQGKASYDRVKTIAEEANASLEASFQTASKGFAALNAKVFDAMRSNSEMLFDFVKAMSAVKTAAEAMTLQSDHARRQMEALTAQNKEIAALAQKATMDAMEPIKAGMNKAVAKAK